MNKVVLSDKQITEIKKKMHIYPIFAYSDSEIALKVCRNKQRFKFNRSPLWQRYKSGTARFNSRNKEYDAKLFFMLLQEYVL